MQQKYQHAIAELELKRIERPVPGFYFQYQQKNYYLLDVNTYIGYKPTARFRTGLGWNPRFVWDGKSTDGTSAPAFFVTRVYSISNLAKVSSLTSKVKACTILSPRLYLELPTLGHREWVWSCMTGIKKEYRIYKNLKGTALIQYNLFNRYYKAPYVDRLNSRIGFEYVLRKKSAKP